MNPQKATWELFFKEFRTFGEMIRGIAASAAKEPLEESVKSYASTLAQWNRRSENTQQYLMSITVGIQQLLPKADKISATAQQRSSPASAALSAA